MLDTIRKQSKSLFVVLILGAIIIVFIFWGIGPTGDGGGGNAVAVVNGAEIAANDYLGFYKRQIDLYQENYKDKFTDEMARSLDFKYQTLNIMINRTLALQAAEDEGVEVSEEEVRESIALMEVFHKDGVFDSDTYFKVLSSNRIMPMDFEASKKSDLMAEKVHEKIAGAVTVTDEDVAKTYLDEFRMVDLAYVEVSPERFTRGITVTDDEARAYLDENASDFVVPARVKAFYAFAPYEDFTKAAKVSGDEIKGFYDEFPGRFSRPEEVRASHILIRPDVTAADKAGAEADARRRAEEALELVKQGEDFAALAEKLSADPGSAARGGDLGWFARGVMIKPFEDTAFSLAPGEVSGVVKTEFGYHIIKLAGRKPSEPMPLKEVSARIEKELKRKKGEEDAREAMEALRREMEEAEDLKALKKAAASHELVKSDSTGLFPESAPQMAFAASERLLDTVFIMNEGRTSNVVPTSIGLYVIRLLERSEPHTPEFDAVSGEIKGIIKWNKAAEAASKASDDYLAKVLGGEDLAKLAAKEGLKVERTDYFARTRGVVPGINASTVENPDLFTLHEGSPYLQKPMVSNGSFYLVEWKGTREADLEGLEKVREIIEHNLLDARREEAIVKWIDGLRARAKIQVYEERL